MILLSKYFIYIIICFCGGCAIASGFVAFITLIGIFPTLSEKYKINNYYKWIETAILFGALIGNIIDFYDIKIPLGYFGLILGTLFGGIFIGCLAGALTETIKVFPILSRRFKLRKLLPYVLIAAGAGKLFGSVLQFFVLM